MGDGVFKTSHHRHSGRVLPHHRTSYSGLALIMLLAGLAMSAISWPVFADPVSQSGNISIIGNVNGAPPSVAPSITTPATNTVTATSPLKVAGLCTTGLVVAIKRNGLNAGSAICSAIGTYELQVQLLPGRNDLIAQQFDTLNQGSPVSGTVTVTYQPPTPPVPMPQPVPTPAPQPGGRPPVVQSSPRPAPVPAAVMATVKYVYYGATPDVKFVMPITIDSGNPPFAINVDWGDGKSDVVSKPQPGELRLSHIYDKSGMYEVVVSISDKLGLTGYIQTVVVVNGQSLAGIVQASGENGDQLQGKILVAWPIYIVMATLLLGFWLGEHYERRLLGQGTRTA